MKIWYVSKYAIAPDTGGATRQYYFAKYFAKYGHGVTLISSRSAALANNLLYKGLSYKREIDNVSCVLLNGPMIKYGFSYKRIISWVIFELQFLLYSIRHYNSKPNVLIVSSLSIFTLVSGVILKKFFRLKLVVEIRDIWPQTLIDFGSFKENNLFIRLLKVIERLGYENADVIIGTMPNLQEHVEKVSGQGSKVKWVPMGYDQDFYPSSQYKPLKDIVSSKLIVGYAGSIGKSNCAHELIDIARLAINLPIEFRILGEGPDKKDLVEVAKKEELHNIIFFDKIPKKDVVHFLQECHLLINLWNKSGIYKFGVSPNKWIDYMLSSRPILLGLSGNPKPFDDIDCGWRVPSNDPEAIVLALQEILKLPIDVLERKGKNGFEYVEKHLNYSNLASIYLNHINEHVPTPA